MLFRYEYQGGVWIDLERPTEEEVRDIAKEFPIGERIEIELLSPTPEPLVASDVGVTFIALHFPTHGAADGEIRDQEVNFVVGKNFIITARYEVVEPLHRLQKILEAQQLISPKDTLSTDALLEILFLHLFTSVREHTSHVADRLHHIERDMFNGLEQTTVRAISNISREFLHTEASLAYQESPLVRFLKAVSLQKFFGDSFEERVERILAERTQVARLVVTYRAVSTDLRETNSALIETKQNEIMKTLTTITVLVMPVELVTFIFSMHALGTPFETDPNAFWIIIAIMFAVGSMMMLFFARKRWIF